VFLERKVVLLQLFIDKTCKYKKLVLGGIGTFMEGVNQTNEAFFPLKEEYFVVLD